MFKNVIAYRVVQDEATRKGTSDFFKDSEALLEMTMSALITEPHKTQLRSIGFAKSSLFGQVETLYTGSFGLQLMMVAVSERVLPGKVIKAQLDHRIADIEKRQDRKLNKKEIMSLKDDVVANLSPKAFIKTNYYPVMFYRGWLFIDTSSAKLADEIVQCIVSAAHEQSEIPLGFIPFVKKESNISRFLRLLAMESTVGCFGHLSSMKLKSRKLGAVTFKDTDFDTPEVEEALQTDREVTEIETVMTDTSTGGQSAKFVINNKLTVRRLQLSDILLNDIRGDADSAEAFDGIITILAATLEKLFKKIDEYCSEEKDDKEDEL